MLSSLLNALFGCSHHRTTFPITPPRRSRVSGEARLRGTYVVCLDCGKEFQYSWEKMQVICESELSHREELRSENVSAKLRS